MIFLCISLVSLSEAWVTVLASLTGLVVAATNGLLTYGVPEAILAERDVHHLTIGVGGERVLLALTGLLVLGDERSRVLLDD